MLYPAPAGGGRWAKAAVTGERVFPFTYCEAATFSDGFDRAFNMCYN